MAHHLLMLTCVCRREKDRNFKKHIMSKSNLEHDIYLITSKLEYLLTIYIPNIVLHQSSNDVIGKLKIT